MKASTLIGLPLVLLLGSFGLTWHLVGISNIYSSGELVEIWETWSTG